MPERDTHEPGSGRATAKHQAATSSDVPVPTATPPAYLVESSQESTDQE